MFREGLRPPDPFRNAHPFEAAVTQDGVSLKTMSGYGPLLVVCLPELSRAKPMLKEVAKHRRTIEESALRILLVHLENDAAGVLEPHDLQYIARIADPDRALYDAFGLGTTRRLLGGAKQSPGVFVVRDGEIVHALGATPDYPLTAATAR